MRIPRQAARCVAIFRATLALAALLAAAPALAERPAGSSGKVTFQPTDQELRVAPRFRLDEHSFPFRLQPLPDVSRNITISDLTFPSAVKTDSPLNNTVHCEYFRPKGKGPFRAVVVLHILGGDFPLSRLFADMLAQHKVAALFVKMPYYGPRRAPGSRRRMVSHDPQETVEGMTQAVLDVRRAVAWLGSRPEIDDRQLGVFGISLGGITGALAATAEPRLKNVCLLLAGGDVAEVTWQSRETRKLRERWVAAGGTKQQLFALLQSVDPVTYGDRIRGGRRRILMINASDDEVVPKACTISLWKSFGEPQIEWFSGGHYSVARHLLTVLVRVPRFFLETG